MTQIGFHRVTGWRKNLNPISQTGFAGETSSVRDNQGFPSHMMDAFGQLATMAAHNFSNLLTVIADFSNLLLGLNVYAVTMTRQLVHVSRNKSFDGRSSRRTPLSRE